MTCFGRGFPLELLTADLTDDARFEDRGWHDFRTQWVACLDQFDLTKAEVDIISASLSSWQSYAEQAPKHEKRRKPVVMIEKRKGHCV